MGNSLEFEAILRETLADGRISRSERRALAAVLEDWGPDNDDLAKFRSRAFVLAREQMGKDDPLKVLDWLEDAVKILSLSPGEIDPGEAYFSPGEACRHKIVELLASARSTVDICVFTITDNTIADAVLAAHKRKVAVRIVTDDQKSYDLGSDIDRLQKAGIPVAVDQSDKHMHHKFAIFDGRIVLTGSYNWTRSAADENEENIVVSREPRLCKAFSDEFESLWKQFR